MVASDHPTLVFPSTQLAMKRVSSLRDRELWRWLHEHEHTWGLGPFLSNEPTGRS